MLLFRTLQLYYILYSNYIIFYSICNKLLFIIIDGCYYLLWQQQQQQQPTVCFSPIVYDAARILLYLSL